MIRLNLDDSLLRRRVERALRNRRAARRDALGVVVEQFVRVLVREGPRDTNRFVRAYQQAANDLGLGPFLVLDVVPGKDVARRERLVRQLRKWSAIVELNERAGRTTYKGVKRTGPDKNYLRAVRLRDRAAKELAEFAENSLVIGGRRGSRGVGQLATVRTKIFGGKGRWIEAGGDLFAEVRNLEPHARIVQRRTKIINRGLGAAGRGALRVVGARYVRQLAEGTDWRRAG